MAIEKKKVYIKKPQNITDKELRAIFKKMKLKTKITKDQMQIHIRTWNDNGIFCLGMRLQNELAIHYLQSLNI